MSASLPLALPTTAAGRLHVSTGGLAGLVLASVALAPPLLGGFVFLDWSDTVEAAVVGLLEAAVVLTWAFRGGQLPRASAPWAPTLILTWIATMALATALAVDVAPAVVRTASWVAHVGFACVVWAEAQQSERAFRAIERGAVAGFIAAIALGTIIWLWERYTGTSRNWMYDVPFVGGVRWVGVYGLVGVCLSAGGLVYSRGSAWVGAAFISVLGWAALWWSASRGALGGALVSSTCLVWASSLRGRTLSAVVGTSLAGAVLSLVVNEPGAGLWRFFGGAVDTSTVASFSSGRTVLWGMAIEAWQHHPWLGLGPGSTISLLAPVGNAHAHNAVLQALVEWGLIGTIPFGLLVGGLAWKAAQVLRRAGALDRRAGAAAYLLATFAASMLDGLTSDPATTALMTAAAALVLVPDRPGVVVPSRWSAAVPVSALAAVGVLLVHLVVLRCIWAPGVPAPDSARSRLVLAAPTYPFAKEVEGWGRDWMHTDPAAATRVAEWGIDLDRSPWLFLRLRGDLALQRGDREAAAADYREAAARYEQATWRLTRYVEGGQEATP